MATEANTAVPKNTVPSNPAPAKAARLSPALAMASIMAPNLRPASLHQRVSDLDSDPSLIGTLCA